MFEIDRDFKITCVFSWAVLTNLYSFFPVGIFEAGNDRCREDGAIIEAITKNRDPADPKSPDSSITTNPVTRIDYSRSIYPIKRNLSVIM